MKIMCLILEYYAEKHENYQAGLLGSPNATIDP